MTRALAFAALGLLISLSGCDRDGESSAHPGGTAVDVTLSPGSPLPREWGELRHFDVSPSGVVVAIDQFDREITIFELDGEIRTIGAPGEGPGEIRRGGRLTLSGDRVLLLDAGRLTAWTLDGTFRESTPVPRSTAVTSDPTSVYLVHASISGGDRFNEIARYDSDSIEESEILGRFPSDTSEAFCLGCSIAVTDSGRLFATSGALSGLIREMSSRPGLVIDPDREPVPWEDHEWRLELERGRASIAFSSTSSVLRREFADARSRPVPPPQFPKHVVRQEGAIGVSAEGLLWVMVEVPYAERSVFDVFDLTTGSRVAIVRVPIPFENVAVDGSWMAGLTFDGLGVASLHRWSIQPALDAIAEAAAGGVD